MPPALDLSKQRFGRLLAISATAKRRGSNVIWRCLCDCGKKTEVEAGQLRNGHTRSCGCLHDDQRRELFSQNNPAIVKHGATRGGKLTCTYNSWMSAKRRCTDQKHHKYSDYGGRGIRMCERWLHNFENFLADMSERPPRRTLDRFPNPNGNYEPGNCRWATAKEQRDNRGR